MPRLLSFLLVLPSLLIAQDNSQRDSVIDSARQAATSFTADLPNFVVLQVTTRFTGPRNVDNWRFLDVVTADLTSANGKEDYRNIQINGKPTTNPEHSGSWSSGEFQLTLEDIFSSLTAADFKRVGQDQITGRSAWVYDFTVDQPHSHWLIGTPYGKEFRPAYKGSIWIDKVSGRTLRIEHQATGLPKSFLYDHAESALDYGFVTIEGKEYLLPIRSENIGCMTGTNNCNRNVLEFRNYRKFTANSSITF